MRRALGVMERGAADDNEREEEQLPIGAVRFKGMEAYE